MNTDGIKTHKKNVPKPLDWLGLTWINLEQLGFFEPGNTVFRESFSKKIKLEIF
jgi:hypothetical protein